MNDRRPPSASLDDLLAMAAGRADQAVRQRVQVARADRPGVDVEIDQWRAIAGVVAEAAAERTGALPAVEPLVAAALGLPGGAAPSGGTTGAGAIIATVIAVLVVMAGALVWQGHAPRFGRGNDAALSAPRVSDAGPVRSPTAVARRTAVRLEAASLAAPSAQPLAIAADASRDVPSEALVAVATRSFEPAMSAVGAEPTAVSNATSAGDDARGTPTAPQPTPTGTPPTERPTPTETALDATVTATATDAPIEGQVTFAIDDPAGEVVAFAWPLDGGAVRTLSVVQGSTHRLPVGGWYFVAQPSDSVPTWLGDGEAASSPLGLPPVVISAGSSVTKTWRFRALGAERATLVGRVEDADGQPVGRAVVHARDGDGRIRSVVVLPGDDGRFDIDVPAGAWTLAAVPEPTSAPVWGPAIALTTGMRTGPIVLRLP